MVTLVSTSEKREEKDHLKRLPFSLKNYIGDFLSAPLGVGLFRTIYPSMKESFNRKEEKKLHILQMLQVSKELPFLGEFRHFIKMRLAI